MRKALVAPLLLFVSVAIAATAKAAPTAELALERYRTAISERGLNLDHQGFVFETLDGQPLLSYNVDCPFNPASVVKLATSDVALDRLGPDFRFATAFYTNGTLDTAMGELHGDLVVIGSGDPSFVTENAFLVARELRSRGIRHIFGNLVVKGPLYCNYSMDRRAAGAVLKAALDVEKWNGAIESSFGTYRVQSGQDSFESITIDGSVVTYDDASSAGLIPLFSLRSMPLLKILKQQNDYSNNWVAHVVGSLLGGAGGVERSLQQRLGAPASELFLQTTSGLGSNGMRPRDIVSLLRDLLAKLHKKSYEPTSLMPVAGVDPGTLEERYLAPGLNGAVIAKTGTLRGVSALAGYMYTRDRGIVLFAIMNEGGTPVTFRRLQDLLVGEMFEACGGPAPLAYHRPVGFGDLAGAFIERAPGSIPEAPKAVVEAQN